MQAQSAAFVALACESSEGDKKKKREKKERKHSQPYVSHRIRARGTDKKEKRQKRAQKKERKHSEAYASQCMRVSAMMNDADASNRFAASLLPLVDLFTCLFIYLFIYL
jgi:hypothetical protein